MLSCSRIFQLLATVGLLASCDASPVNSWSPAVVTSKGTITGQSTSSGVRYTVPYAKPPTGALRFRRPEALDSFTSTRHRRFEPRCAKSNRSYDGTQLPKACWQQQGNDAETSEDCLYMTVYTPKNTFSTSKLPVMVWVHGGSFVTGSSSAIDGSALANAQNMIVITVQYRLGVFGWLKYDPWNVEGNFGLRDLIMALQVVQTDIAAFGGDPSLVTLAGQSSGAQMVKALLSAPSADSLFKRAILHSAPLDYSPQSPATANAVGDVYTQDILNASNNQAFLYRMIAPVQVLDDKNEPVNENGKPVKLRGKDGLLLAQLQLGSHLNDLPSDVDIAEILNIVADGDLLSGDGQQIVNSGKEVIFTTTKDEGCAGVSQGLKSFQPYFDAGRFSPTDTEFLVSAFYGERTDGILDSGLYTSGEATVENVDSNLVQLATDFYWVCSNQQFAVAAAASSKVFLGEFDLGIQASSNSKYPLCQGKVGHEDDIAVVFNTPSGSISSAQSNLVKEVQARWGSFVRTGDPNTSSYTNWPALSAGGGLNVLQLGSTSKGGSSLVTSQRTDACKLYASI